VRAGSCTMPQAAGARGQHAACRSWPVARLLSRPARLAAPASLAACGQEMAPRPFAFARQPRELRAVRKYAANC
jgi:hypothetical protein